MNKLFPILLLSASPLFASGDRINVAEDEANHSNYNAGWEDGKNAGIGFGGWILKKVGGLSENSHSGFFIASSSVQQDIDNVAPAGKAFGMFANGVGFEVACAFRTFDAPLAPGDSFSLMMESRDFIRKFETDDPRPGVVGFSLRTGAASDVWEDFQTGARLQFGFYEGDGSYMVFDGEESHDTGVPISDKGIAVTVTLVTPDTYDLEITNLDSKETTRLEGRKLGGDPATPIESFVIYNQDGETGDAYFNGFQVSRAGESLTR